MEEKQKICDAFLVTLRLTEHFKDLERLDYIDMGNDYEKVVAVFANGHTKEADVTWDSGMSMIRDIVNQIF